MLTTNDLGQGLVLVSGQPLSAADEVNRTVRDLPALGRRTLYQPLGGTGEVRQVRIDGGIIDSILGFHRGY
jgi:hypothetical protein